jgi:hypothetical protein
MKKTILEVYAMTVCFFAVIVITISLSTVIYNAVGSINPELSIRSHTYEKHLNNENFKSMKGCSKEEAESLSEDEITAKRVAAYTVELRTEKRKKLQNVLESSTYTFVATIVFLIHMMIAKGSRKTSASG